MKKTVFFTGFLSAFLAFSPLKAEDLSLGQVVLRGLDKITGRLSTMTVNVGEKTQFGALDIYVRVCYAHPPEETPENAAYLDVVENKPEGQLKLFSGWMFSSSPALSAMDHPVFDIWVIRCQGDQITPPQPEALVLENQIETQPIQPKVKIAVEKADVPAQTTAEEPANTEEQVFEEEEEVVREQAPAILVPMKEDTVFPDEQPVAPSKAAEQDDSDQIPEDFEDPSADQDAMSELTD